MPTKPALRRTALAARRALPPAEVARRSELLGQHLFQEFSVARWRWLHLFLPLAAQGEPDTWPVIRRVWRERLPVQLAAPVVQPDGVTLCHYALTPDTRLHPNRWGIPEPVADPAAEVPPGWLDAVLVPLLYCDQTGQRVGYGGGFYDRFLAQCRPGAPLIGLNVLDEPPGELLTDVLPTDVTLTACVTPGGVWKF